MKYVVVAAGLIVAVNLLAGDRGLPALLESRRDAARLTAQITVLRAENAALAARIHALTSDPATIEAVARQTLGLSDRTKSWSESVGPESPATAQPSGDR